MKTADMVLFSTAIFDSVRNEPFPGGIVICGEQIEYVGSRESASKYIGPLTVVRDFGDRLIMPGFCDGHMHLEGCATTFCAVKVQGLGKCRSEAECVKKVIEFHNEHPELKRITGMGWTLNDWGNDAPLPTRHSLDAAFPDIPVYLQAADAHTGWVNTAAIEECGLEEHLRMHPEYDPLWAPREPDGSLTGFLREGAAVYPYFESIKLSDDVYARYVAQFLDICSSYGITGMTEVSMMKASRIPDFFAPVKALERSGRLPVRVHMWPGSWPKADGDNDGVHEFVPYLSLFSTDMLHISGLKSLVDGITESHTAAMLDPYAGETDAGQPRVSQEELNKWVARANAAGFSVKLHCIGDRGVRMALNAFEASAAAEDVSDVRNTIEHLENVDDADVPRFGRLHVIASFQPAHMVLSKGFSEKNLGLERFKREFRWRDVISGGAHFALGTDAPVVHLNPFVSIFNAVTRLDEDGSQYSPYTAEQKLTLPEALKGYTVGTAYANRFEHKVGTLEKGKYADIVVWDRNPFAIDSMEIKDCRAVFTVCNGRIVYEP